MRNVKIQKQPQLYSNQAKTINRRIDRKTVNIEGAAEEKTNKTQLTTPRYTQNIQ